MTAIRISSKAQLFALILTASACLAKPNFANRVTRLDRELSDQPARLSNFVMSGDGSVFAFVSGDSLFVEDVESQRAHAVLGQQSGESTSPFPFIAFSPDKRLLIARRGFDPFGSHDADLPVLIDLVSGDVRGVLPDSLAGRVHTFQNHLADGPRWSPSGRFVAFLGADKADSTFSLQLYVVDVARGSVLRLTSPPQARFSIAWSPDGKWLAYSSGRLGQRASEIELLPTADSIGGAKVIYRDSTGPLLSLQWASNSRLLLVQDRLRRTLVLRVDSAGAAAVAPSSMPPRRYAGWIPNRDALLTAVSARMSSELAVVSIGGVITRHQSPRGTITPISIARRGIGARIGYTVTSGSAPLDFWIDDIDSTGETVARRRLTDAAESVRAPLPESRVIAWQSSIGDTLFAQLLLPRNHRAPYRLIVVPYGGYGDTFPESDSFLEKGFLPLLSEGWAIIRPNTHGIATDTRDAGAYGAPQLADTERLLATLSSQGLIDPSRVAVLGHSHGGALAYYYLTHSSAWCGVVAINGRADWVLQAKYDADGVLPDALGGTPDSLPARYQAFSPVANARNATAPVLAVAGMRDSQILPANLQVMFDSMHVAGKVIDTMTFAREGHLIQEPMDQRRLWNGIMSFLNSSCANR